MVQYSFFNQIIVYQSFLMACWSHLVIFYFKEKFCVLVRICKSLARCLLSKTFQRPCRKKCISGSTVYLTQLVHSYGKILLPWWNNCLLKFLWCGAHILLFLTFFNKKLCVLARVFKSLAWAVFTCVEKMLSFSSACSMEMGLLKRPSLFLFDKKVNFWFNSKIISLLIDLHSVIFLSKCAIAKC